MSKLTRTDMLIALAAAVLVTILQAAYHINGLLSTLVGILVGAVGTYFGLSALAQRQFDNDSKE